MGSCDRTTGLGVRTARPDDRLGASSVLAVGRSERSAWVEVGRGFLSALPRRRAQVLLLFAVFKVKNSGELAVIALFRFARTEDFCGQRRFRRCFILEEQRKQRPWDR